MTFRSLALNNIRGNWRAYAAFFLSSVFSVLIFYLYASFVNHPDVVSGHIRREEWVRSLMRICMYVIVIFSFFFALYSNSSFIKTRKKEFGLLSLFGTTRFQLRKMVVYESLAVALLSIVTGIGLGILFSKLFLMALGVMLQHGSSLRFTVPLPALLLTLFGFSVLFIIIALLTALTVGRTEIVDLLGDSHRPKKQPVASPLLVALAMLTIGAGYVMAAMVTKESFMVLALPIIGSTVLGTYFLYTQFSTAVIKLLQRRKHFYYRGTNLLTVSQMAFRIKDNSRVLFVVTVLAAVVMSAVSTVYVVQRVERDELLKSTPFTISYFEAGKDHSVLAPEEAVKRLQEGGASISEQVEVHGLKAEKIANETLGLSDAAMMIVSLSDYNKLALRMKLPERQLGGKAAVEGFVVYPLYREGEDNGQQVGKITGRISGKPFRLAFAELVRANVVSWISKSPVWLLVVPDQKLTQWKKESPVSSAFRFYGFELHDWEHQLAAVENFENGLTAEQRNQTDTHRVGRYQDGNQATALTLFIGLFISALFFIASGSLLYFKLFTELQGDRSQFRALHRIGFTVGELFRTIGVQVATLFLLPCLVGIVHSLFAMLTLGALADRPVWMYGLVIMGIYVLMQAVYGVIAYIVYTRSIIRSVVS